MRKGKPSMKKEKPQIGVRPMEKSDDMKALGIVKFGKARPSKKKYVLVDIEYDDEAEKKLFKMGLELLQLDKEAVLNYVIVKALEYTAEFAKAKCKK